VTLDLVTGARSSIATEAVRADFDDFEDHRGAVMTDSNDARKVNGAPPMPNGLKEGGQWLWDAIAGDPIYVLRPDEWRMLADACRETDIIDRLQTEFDLGETTTKGSMGQEVAAPTLSELRQHRATLAGLFSKLKLPDTSGSTARKSAYVSEQAAKAARARWGSGGKKPA
jgi:hypothetical protein